MSIALHLRRFAAVAVYSSDISSRIQHNKHAYLNEHTNDSAEIPRALRFSLLLLLLYYLFLLLELLRLSRPLILTKLHLVIKFTCLIAE
jgi:hypothetical protein